MPEGVPKELLVGQGREHGIVGCHDDIVPVIAKAPGRQARVVGVQEELQLVRRSRPRCQSLSASSAAAALPSISGSISAVNSA